MRIMILGIVCIFCRLGTVEAQPPREPTIPNLQFDFVESIPLPDVVIDSKKARIHSQGLFVTDKHFLVTGRLETQPKRALLIRFPRESKSPAEFLDITPEFSSTRLDHPGGFDRDEDGIFHIPLSTSNRKGPTVVNGYRISPDRPLTEAAMTSSVRVEDHLGAICCLGDTLVGANWDTLLIYFIRNGAVTGRMEQAEMLSPGLPHVAVQDWKSFPRKTQSSLELRALSGGIAKSEESQAIIQVVDLLAGRVLETHRLSRQDGISKPVTNEGLAVHDGEMYLLPEDIGHGAKVLRYKIRSAKKTR